MTKTIRLNDPVYNKLRRMGFSGQSLGELIDDLCDYAKDNKQDFSQFLDSRYDDEEEEDD